MHSTPKFNLTLSSENYIAGVYFFVGPVCPIPWPVKPVFTISVFKFIDILLNPGASNSGAVIVLPDVSENGFIAVHLSHGRADCGYVWTNM